MVVVVKFGDNVFLSILTYSDVFYKILGYSNVFWG